MMTLESRLATVVSQLPSGEKPRFAEPLALDESADSRLVDAVRVLARAEGLVCMSPGEFAHVVAQQIAQRSIPATDAPAADAPADDDAPAALAARFAAITGPRAQTAFWRSRPAEQRAAILKAKQPQLVMPNTLTNVHDIKVAQRVLQPFTAVLTPMRAFSTNFSPDPADKLDTVRVPIVSPPS